MKTIRTFLAITLPDEVSSSAARWMDAAGATGDGIKWVPKDNLHLTLKFLGEVDNVETPRVCQTLATICESIDPFDLHFLGTDGLPSLERARVLTVKVEDPSGSLTRMVGEIERRFAELGFKPEPRDYRPHLTLGRIRRGSRSASDEVIERWREFQQGRLGELTVRQTHVVGSFLEKRGPVYTIMNTVDL